MPPPGRSIASAAASVASSWPSSSSTVIRRAWKTRFAGCPSPKRAGVGIAILIVSTSSPVRVKGAPRADERSRAQSGRQSAPRRSGGRRASSRSSQVSTSSAAEGSEEGSIRMSSGASVAYENPRSGRSTCIDETPRSSRIASAVTSLTTTAQDDREISSQEAHLEAACRSLEPIEIASGARIAVDRHELPTSTEIGGEETTVTTGAERGVDHRLARLHGEKPADLVREHGDVVSAFCRRSATSSTLPSIPSSGSAQAGGSQISRWS